MKAKGCTIWLTGLSGSGKTTIAQALKQELLNKNIKTEVLDGDIIRENLSKGLTFSKEDRDINVLRIGFVAELLSRNDIFVIVSAISPYRASRDLVRSKIDNYVEVYVNCSLEECEKRDVKGLYAKVRAGEIKGFTGIDDPYEPPVRSEIICNTEMETLEESVAKILSFLKERSLI